MTLVTILNQANYSYTSQIARIFGISYVSFSHYFSALDALFDCSFYSTNGLYCYC
ncbi:hypothetical protein PPBDW_II0443 [Photobacterium kishitanii]|nr:hypothetical protein PPBDW_II0443 [Photobacterium kishitanii]